MNIKKFSARLYYWLLAILFCKLVTVTAGAITIDKDVAYLSESRAEKMDIYLPDDSFQRPLPAILLIHGGGWMVGDKASTRERNIATTLSEAGYAVFSINYILNQRDENKRNTFLAWPQNVYDCKTALRYMRAHSEQYGIASDRIGVMGGSAGGQLSMMLGATINRKNWNQGGEYLSESNDVQCIINLYGPADVRGRPVHPFSGMPKSYILEHAAEASPVTYFDTSLPPMLILQGTDDHTIPVEQTRELVKALQELGTKYCYLELSGAPHSFHLQPEQMDLRPVVLSFLHKHL